LALGASLQTFQFIQEIIVGAIFVFTVVSMIVLRAAVIVANKCIGSLPLTATNPDDEELDEWIGYRHVEQTVDAIPKPGFLKSIGALLGMCAIVFVVSMLLSVYLGLGPFDPTRRRGGNWRIVPFALGIVVSFPLCGWLLSAILPTKFSRGCLVLLLCYGIVIASAAIVKAAITIIDF
jgi:hypothetical protein